MMKKILAVLSVAALLVSFAACGKTIEGPADSTNAAVTVEVETTVSPTQPEAGRVKEMTGFYVYTPEDWCQRTYQGNGYRIELFDIPSAPDIKADTACVEIKLFSKGETKETVDATFQKLLAREDAKQGKDAKIGGYDFSVVSYKDAAEERTHIVYIGLVEDKISTVTLKGISAKDEDVAAILKSISYK